MPKINANALKSFNLAIAHTYEPETPPLKTNDNYEYLRNFIAQQTDIFNALMYAQDEILPLLRNGFVDITPQQFLNWIKKIHENVAGELYHGLNKVSSTIFKPGEFTSTAVFRWENGYSFQDVIEALLSCSEEIPLQVFQVINENYQVDPELLKKFLHLLCKIREDQNIQTTKKHVSIVSKTFDKLQFAYHRNLLTTEEKKLIRSFVKPCILVSDLQSAMENYAIESLEKLKKCDIKNEQLCVETVAEIFYGLVDIHPFINGNGRTATILLNTLLVAMNYPSIVLRYPGDKDDKDSDYTLAFNDIENTREPFVQLIFKRLHNGLFEDKASECAMLYKAELSDEIANLSSDFIKYAMRSATGCVPTKGEFVDFLIEKFGEPDQNKQTPSEIQRDYARFSLDFISKKRLERIQETYKTKKDFVLMQVSRVTNTTAGVWKCFNDKTLYQNPIVYREFADENMRDACANILKDTMCMSVICTKRKDNGIPVIKLENFNFQKLHALQYPVHASIAEEDCSMKMGAI